jgi:hypothetical protein
MNYDVKHNKMNQYYFISMAKNEDDEFDWEERLLEQEG